MSDEQKTGQVVNGDLWRAEAIEVIKAWESAWDALPDSWREGRLGQSKARVVTEYIWKTQVEA